MPLWDSILEWLGKNVRWEIMFGIFAATGVLLFFAVQLGIDAWAHPYRGWEITAFVFSGAVLFAYIGAGACSWLLSIARKAWSRHLGKKHLHHLNLEEKKYCKSFVDGKGAPIADNPANGAIASLELNGIVWRPSTGWDWEFHFNIHTWALEYLNKHPELFRSE